MINIDKLKPIIEPLLEGREDSADIIEAIGAIDEEVSVDRSEIDALNASWNDRFKKAFFGAKADNISEEIPTAFEEETATGEAEAEELTYDNLFKEAKED